MKRPALQSERVGVLWMAFQACKVFGSFEKCTPGLQEPTRVGQQKSTNADWNSDKVATWR